MASFNKAFQYLLSNEDYPATDPRYGQTHIDNNGGKVRFGINSKSFPDIEKDGFYTRPIDEAIKMAMNLYNIFEWTQIHGDSLHSQRVASKLLDLSVNTGIDEASKLAQRAANVNVDGVIGPITVDAINQLNEDAMLKNVIYWWQWFITQELNNKPQDKAYEDDWRARADKLPPIDTTGAL